MDLEETGESGGPMGILIIDDGPINIKTLEGMLRNAGYGEIYTARSALEAFEHLGILNVSKEKQNEIQLILMDFMMSDMDGLDACRQIKSVDYLQDIPIIMMTSKTDSEHLNKAFEVGAIDLIKKPIRNVEALARVRSYLNLNKEIEERKLLDQRLQDKQEALDQAMREIRILQGFIPICTTCFKIRDLRGEWRRMEAYIQQKPEIRSYDELCEKCLRKHLSREPQE